MKHKTLMVLIVLCLVRLMGNSVSAQEFKDTLPPVMPLDIIRKGRQAVMSELGRQVEYVVLKTSGGSVAGPQTFHLQREQLRSLGYVHDGAFTELFTAVESVLMEDQVIPLPRGGYDFRLEEEFFSSDGSRLLRGSAYADFSEFENGELVATFNPWVWFDGVVAFETEEYPLAQWVGTDWGRGSQQLDISYNSSSRKWLVSVPLDLIGNGLLVVKAGGVMVGYDLKNGESILGLNVLAWVWEHQSNDIEIVTDVFKIGTQWSAYQGDNGRVYGRIPLTELSFEGGTYTIKPMLRVWGTALEISPKSIKIKVVSSTSLQSGTEFDLIWAEKGDGWVISLPKGIYHLRFEMSEIVDWTWDPNPKG